MCHRSCVSQELCFTGGCVSREGAQSLQMKASRVGRGKQGQSSAVQICRLLIQAFLFRDFLPLLALDTVMCVKCSTRKWLQETTYRSLFFLSFGFGSRLAIAPPRICPDFPSLQESLHISEKDSIQPLLCFHSDRWADCSKAARIWSATAGIEFCREPREDDCSSNHGGKLYRDDFFHSFDLYFFIQGFQGKSSI